MHLSFFEKRNKANFCVEIATMFFLCNIFDNAGYSPKQSDLIYILEWTPVCAEPFNFLEEGQKAFETRKCVFQNCFITSNHTFFRNILDFDVLIFNAVHLKDDVMLPPQRSKNQKYIMVSMEPAGYYPVPTRFNDFFNYTWTYKLDSSIPWPYIRVKNQFGEVIGPKVEMNWMKIEEMNKTSQYTKHKLRNKSVAAALFVSNCMSYKRLKFAHGLHKELAKYGERVDIYGKCGNNYCPVQRQDECFALIESDYYFFLAFENSFGADYVSEKLLHPLEHFAVPVVLGGANYSRFMPDGIYLNALSLGPAELAKKMSEIINDTNKYYEFFKWHGYYSFHFSGEDWHQREVCALCEALNNRVFTNQSIVFNNLTQWWNEKYPAYKHGNENENELYLNLVLDDDGHESSFNGIISSLSRLFGSND